MIGLGSLAISAFVLYFGITRYQEPQNPCPAVEGRRLTLDSGPYRRSAGAAPHHAHTMAQRLPQIVAFGGGGFSMEAGNPLLDDYVLSLTGGRAARASASCRRRPVTPTTTSCASTAHFAGRCDASHVSLFRRDRGERRRRGRPRGAPARAGPIYVGGGNVVSMLGAWRAHGLDEVLREAWRRGRRAVRAVGRLAVLVRRVADRVPRRAAARARARHAARTPTACTTTREPARRDEYHALRRRRHAPRLRGRGRRGAALPRDAICSASSRSRPTRARLPRRADRRRGRRDAAGGRLPRGAPAEPAAA